MPESISTINSSSQGRPISAVLILFVLVAGCREILPYRRSVPEISGILLLNGSPLPDIVINSCVERNVYQRCVKLKKTTTDSQGQFYFDSANEFIKNVSRVGDSSFRFNINFQYLGRDYQWNGGGGELPDNVNLRCDISHQDLCTVHQFNP